MITQESLIEAIDSFRVENPELVQRFTIEEEFDRFVVTFFGPMGLSCPFGIKFDNDSDLVIEFFIPAMNSIYRELDGQAC